jgi:hypothetical protein
MKVNYPPETPAELRAFLFEKGYAVYEAAKTCPRWLRPFRALYVARKIGMKLSGVKYEFFKIEAMLGIKF